MATSYDELLNKLKDILDKNKDSFNKFKNKEEQKKTASSLKGNFQKIDDEINESFLAIGELLNEAKNSLNSSNYSKLKNYTLEFVSHSKSEANLNKVIKIAENSWIKEHKDKLPSSWGTLAIISQLNKFEFNEFIKDESLSPTKSRADILNLVKKCQGKENIKKITIEKDSSATTYSSRDDVLIFLFEHEHKLKELGWKIKIDDKSSKTNQSNKSENNHN